MPKLIVSIIDYQISNLFSVKHACEHVGLNVEITSNPEDIKNSDAIILPGVGAFGDAMKNLKKLNLINPILEHIKKEKPFLGICLGMQLLFDTSEEFGSHKGLGILKGKVIKFSNKEKNGIELKIPHMGWNKIFFQKDHPYFKGIKNNEFMYFVHSYFVKPDDKEVILAKTYYEGIEFTSAVSQNNVFAVQFHPEKSGPEGLKIYYNFAKLLNKK